MKYTAKIIGILLILSVNNAVSAETEKHNDAKQLYELTKITNDQAVIAHFVNSAIKGTPSLSSKKEIITDFMRDFVKSDEYTEGKIKIYMDLYTDKELKEALKLFKNPIYKKLKEKQAEVFRRGAEHTKALYKKKIPELQELLKK